MLREDGNKVETRDETPDGSRVERRSSGRLASATGRVAYAIAPLDGPITRDIDRWKLFLKGQVAAMAVPKSAGIAAE